MLNQISLIDPTLETKVLSKHLHNAVTTGHPENIVHHVVWYEEQKLLACATHVVVCEQKKWEKCHQRPVVNLALLLLTHFGELNTLNIEYIINNFVCGRVPEDVAKDEAQDECPKCMVP